MSLHIYAIANDRYRAISRASAGGVGLSVDGYRMPYGEATELRRNLYANNQGNQASPILISSKGRYVWSEMPYRYTFAAGVLSIDKTMDLVHVGDGARYACRCF